MGRPTLAEHCRNARRIVVLSPHCDDAAFSVAGLLRFCSGLGKKITIITCFSRSSYAPRLIFKNPERVSRIRKREDAEFVALLHPCGEMIWLGWDDAALRDDYRGRDVCTPRPLSRTDLALTAKLADWLSGAIPPDSLILVPLGLGHHPDHRIVREAGLALAAEGAHSLFLYEDLPYALEQSLETLDKWVAGFSLVRAFRLDPVSTSFPGLLGWKRRAAQCYRSQTAGNVVERIMEHARRLDPSGPGAERAWWASYDKTRAEMRTWTQTVALQFP